MKIFHPLLLSFFFALQTAIAQSEEIDFQPLPRSAIGVLHLSIFPIEGITNKTSKSIPVRKAPDFASPLVMVLKSKNDLTSTREVDYEHSAAVVFIRKQDWYQVATRFGKGWISGKDAGDFIAVEKIFYSRMSFLRAEEWNGVIYPTPSLSKKPIPINWKTHHKGDSDATFLEWKVVEGQPWIRVRLLAKAYCEDITVLDRDIVGWIPAYSQKGNLVMWYYSRGC